MNTSKTHNDKKLISFLNSRKTYLAILVLSVIYLFLDDSVLNEPFALKISKWVIAIFFTLVVCYSRFLKFKAYYSRKIRDFIFIISALFITALFTIFFQAILSILTNLTIILFSTNSQVEYRKCPITNVITTGIDKVHFIFEGQKYSRYFEVNEHTREELINNFHLQVGLKKSIGNSYYLESLELQEK